VSAVEVVAVHTTGTKPVWRRFEEAMPEVWANLVTGGGHEHAQIIGSALAPLVRSTDRFIKLLSVHGPSAPTRRPAEPQRIDWDDLGDRLRAVYNYRSRVLHDGLPFPDPMCSPPMEWDGDVPVEKAPWLSSTANAATWSAEAIPMFIHTFEYIVRGALTSWWRGRGVPRP
jgi:hypothetical protein